jgi:hypothetical protein
MKYILKYDSILENLSQAKAVLRKVGSDVGDERYKKILDKTNKDGYTGLITKLVFIDEIEIDEVLSLYDQIKQNKLDSGKLIKLSYDEILDLIYDFSDEKNDIIFLKQVDNYKVFLVKTYNAGLEINSPSWCLKTKFHWDNWNKKGVNLVAIDQKFVKGNKTNLPTPNTFFGDTYTNTKNPSIRYGITLFKNKIDYNYFNDDNTQSVKDEGIIKKIILEIKDIVIIDNSLTITKDEEEMVSIIDTIFDDILDITGFDNYITFDFGGYRFSHSDTEKLETALKTKTINYENSTIPVIDFLRMEEIKNIVLGHSNFISNSGIYDIILYILYGKNSHPLSGMYLSEREDYDKCYRYTYGIHKTLWGMEYILQSYNNPQDYYLEVVKNFHMFVVGDKYFGEINQGLRIDSNDISEDFINFYTYRKVENHYIINFYVEEFLEYLKTKNIEITFWMETEEKNIIDRIFNILSSIMEDITIKKDGEKNYFEIPIGKQ